MGEPVSPDRKKHPGENAQETKECPKADQRKGFEATRQRIDHAPEQHGFGELQHGSADIGEHQEDSEPKLRPKHRKRAPVGLQDRDHACAAMCWFKLCRSF